MVNINFINIAFIVSSIVVYCDSLQIVDRLEKLRLTIYTTSLCKDTKKFLLNDFIPAYRENSLKDYIEVEFVPWGKASRIGDAIHCQFGENDCMANKIHSCALHLLGSNQEKKIDYIECEFVNLLATMGSLQCSSEVGLSPDDVSLCYGSALGRDLERNNEIRTKSIPLSFVPTIVFNEQYYQHLQDGAFTNFKQTICQVLGQSFPGVCGSVNILQ